MDSRIEIFAHQAEKAYQSNINSLLPRSVYQKIQLHIESSLNNALSAKTDRFNNSRVHQAILIEGARGAGKSSVLVNLRTYLHINMDCFSRVHVLDPVDPTLLETDDDVFLNVIIAAILNDDLVQRAQEQFPEKRIAFQNQLQKLGMAFEDLQTSKVDIGLDKLRSFMGTSRLSQETHSFFEATLKLIDKDLFVFTIDDVDTSLQHAFENLEVLRRYLTSPYVLPIVSGDRSLYLEVTWRDFFGRLINENNYRPDNAYSHAMGLAHEYHRKIFPPHLRLTLPTVNEYLSNPNIFITWKNERPSSEIQLSTCHELMQSFIQGPINGLEGSSIQLPIPTIRSLAQFINKMSDNILSISQQIDKSSPDVPSQLWGGTGSPGLQQSLTAAIPSLLDYFRHEPLGATVYLILQAMKDWSDERTSADQSNRSILRSKLFQPLAHAGSLFELFDTSHDLSEWQSKLKGRLPQNWLSQLPDRALVAYPVPEIGRAVARSSIHPYEGETNKNFLLALLLDDNYYVQAKRAPLIRVGRIFELIILSIIRDVTTEDIHQIIHRPPFFSLGHIASTKTLEMGEESTDAVDDNIEATLNTGNYDSSINEISNSINEWRKSESLSEIHLSPWLAYKVFNKFVSQAWYFNKPLEQNQQPTAVSADNIIFTAKQAFNSIWASFGSFEKGPVFGLSRIISTTNIGNGSNFENSDLYTRNIKELVDAHPSLSITARLATHPFNALTKDLHLTINQAELSFNQSLRSMLGLSFGRSRKLSPTGIKRALSRKSLDERLSILEKAKQLAKPDDNDLKLLESTMSELTQNGL